jgi:hypothetical protein
MKVSTRYVCALLSAGWLVPLYFSATNFVAYVETELKPLIVGRPVTHSFPILMVWQFWFTLAVLWLAVVIICWSLRFLRGPNPQGGANGRQPFSSETNRTSAAAASRRSP